MYTAFIRVSGLKLWSLGDCSCAIFLRGYASQENCTIAVTKGPIVLTRTSHGRIYLYTGASLVYVPVLPKNVIFTFFKKC